jgi:hypothetical protein
MYTPPFRPQPFGPVTVTAPGTLVSLSSQLVAQGICSATDRIPVNKIDLKPLTINHGGAGNTGNVYIGFVGMNKLTGYNVLATLVPGGPDFSITNNVGSNTYDFETYVMDADNGGDGVYGSTDQN